MGSEGNFRITKMAGDSVTKVGNIKQGVGNIETEFGIQIVELKYGVESMSVWNDECVVTLEREKKKKRVLPDWILKGGKKIEPPDTEKISSDKAEKNNSKVVKVIKKK